MGDYNTNPGKQLSKTASVVLMSSCLDPEPLVDVVHMSYCLDPEPLVAVEHTLNYPLQGGLNSSFITKRIQPT